MTDNPTDGADRDPEEEDPDGETVEPRAGRFVSEALSRMVFEALTDPGDDPDPNAITDEEAVAYLSEDPRREIPQVEVLAAAVVEEYPGPVPAPLARRAARQACDEARAENRPINPDALLAAAELLIRQWEPPRDTINATGVLLHTNMGRAQLLAPPWGPHHCEDLEMDLSSGLRGRRQEYLTVALEALTGAEAAMVLNNNAGAVMLAVSSLAAGREVLMSRGQVVEIGGGVSMGEVAQQCGAKLREVGSTNRTAVKDYADAIDENTAAMLWVHPSNYTMSGFTSAATIAELGTLSHDTGIPLICDLGSGLLDERCGWLRDGPPAWLADEPGVIQALQAGAEVVTFSGDKLFGGPQAGIICGRERSVEPMRDSPLARTLRYDRVRSAYLYDVLERYLEGAAVSIPFWSSVNLSEDELWDLAKGIVSSLPDHIPASIEPGIATVGGGAAPGSELVDAVVTIECGARAEQMATALRAAAQPLVPLVRDTKVLIHVRSISLFRIDDVAELVTAAYDWV